MRMTPHEITLVVIIIVALLAGTLARHYRQRHPSPSAPSASATAKPTPLKTRVKR